VGWALACLGIRLRLHRRLLVAGVPLPVTDWVLRAFGTRWIPKGVLALLVFDLVQNPQRIPSWVQATGWRDGAALVVAGAFRLFATATFWAEFRAVEVHRLHRMDLSTSLTWEVAFWALIGLAFLPTLLQS